MMKYFNINWARNKKNLDAPNTLDLWIKTAREGGLMAKMARIVFGCFAYFFGSILVGLVERSIKEWISA